MSRLGTDPGTIDSISSHGKPALLMCSPSLYDVSYVNNPWMEGNVGGCSKARAMTQWQRLQTLLTRVAQVRLIEPVPGVPDMVFTANAGLVRGTTVVLSRFRHPERQGEEEHFRRWFAEWGYSAFELPREVSFEGEGDALFSCDEQHLWIGHGARTASESHALLQAALDVQVTSLHLVDPRFYHLDTCFAPLPDGAVMYYPAAFDEASLAAIEAFYAPEQRVAVSEQDAAGFACNVVSVGWTLFLNKASLLLQSQLAQRGFQVVETPLDEFMKGGGAAKCLVMRLSTELRAPALGLSYPAALEPRPSMPA